MKIAIVTGASSGMGRKFVLALDNMESIISNKKAMKFDEIWVIARRKDRLLKLQEEVNSKLRILPLDLTKKESFEEIEKILKAEQPEVRFLVNASGFGKFNKSNLIDLNEQIDMVDLNIKSLMVITNLCIPYMTPGSKIIEISSQSAWQPLPYINVYGSTKAFVLHYSRALNRELKKDGIHVLAVCPFWTRTEFFNHAVDKKNEVVKYYACLYEPEAVVRRAVKDAFKKKDVSLYGFKSKVNVLLAKIIPHKIVMSVWMKQQKLK